MNRGEFIAELPRIAEKAKFSFNGYESPFQAVTLTDKEVTELIIIRNYTTDNVLAVLRESEKWHFTAEQKHRMKDLDSLFRWTAVENELPLLCLESPIEKQTQTSDVYLLLRLRSDCFMGLKTSRCYLQEEN